LLNKLDILTNNIGMANVCNVPLSYLFLRGQGVKILSLISMYCRKENYLIKVLEKAKPDEADDGYEGAIVLKAMQGIYLKKAVAVGDFNSLYPSCMISENLSHDSYVLPESKYYNSLPKNSYVDISYDLYKEECLPGRKKKIKVKCGVQTCRFYQPPNGEKSLVPRILQILLKARSDTRKDQSKYDKASFEWKLQESMQLAYKLSANSLYGQIGARTSAVYLKEIAACTTATGRGLIYFTKNFFETNYAQYKARVIYGDSVLGNTPLLLLDPATNNIIIRTIETLADDNMWTPYNEFKPLDTDRSDKQQATCSYMVWTNGKWSPIKRVIRHKTKKDIYRVTTHTGTVDVTEDHSLLDKDLNIIKPKSAVIGTELLHSFPDLNEITSTTKLQNYKGIPKSLNEIIKDIYNFDTINQNITVEEMEAFIFGFFFSDGSCNKYYYPGKGGYKYSWALNNADIRLLNKSLEYLKKIEHGKTNFKILDTIKSSNVYKLVPHKHIKYMVTKYRSIFYDKDSFKIIPDKILNSSYSIRYNFLLGYYAGDGSKCFNDKNKSIRFDNKGKIGSSHLYYLLKSLGYTCSINTRDTKSNIFRITATIGKQRKNPIAIKKNQLLIKEYTDYVYDLETEEGCFQAGIGEIIVKNTDSVFIEFTCYDKYGFELMGLDAVYKAILLCNEGTVLVSRQLKKPHNIDFEKAIWPFILFTKKRYVGVYHTIYGINTCQYMNSMGIVLRRRDNANIVKTIYGAVLDKIMKEFDIDGAIETAKTESRKMLEGKYPIDEFIVTKSLKGYYKNGNQIAHNVLSQTITKRDPGNKPQTNDRIQYIYMYVPEDKAKNMLQGERIETPQFIKEHNLQIDYRFYLTNQVMKPVSQIFELVTNDLAHIFYEQLRDYDYKKKGIQMIDKWYKVTKIDKKEYMALNNNIKEILNDNKSSNDDEDDECEIDTDISDEE